MLTGKDAAEATQRINAGTWKMIEEVVRERDALRAENATLIKALAHERVRNGELRAEVLDVRESLSAAESREVCTVAHDGDVATCGYCQRDALRARVAELEAAGRARISEQVKEREMVEFDLSKITGREPPTDDGLPCACEWNAAGEPVGLCAAHQSKLDDELAALRAERDEANRVCEQWRQWNEALRARVAELERVLDGLRLV